MGLAPFPPSLEEHVLVPIKFAAEKKNRRQGDDDSGFVVMGGVGRHRRHGKKSQCRHTNTLSLTVAYLDLSVGLHIVRENNRLVRNTRPPLHEGGSADRRADRLRSAQQQYAASLAQLTCDAAGGVPQCSGRRSREAVLRKDVSRFSMYKVPVVSKEDSTSHQSTCNANCILPGTSNAGVHKKKKCGRNSREKICQVAATAWYGICSK